MKNKKEKGRERGGKGREERGKRGREREADRKERRNVSLMHGFQKKRLSKEASFKSVGWDADLQKFWTHNSLAHKACWRHQCAQKGLAE